MGEKAFQTKQERDQFTVEQLKNCIHGDLRALIKLIGLEAVTAWIQEELPLPF